MDTKQRIGELLKKARKEAGLSQDDIAKELETSRQYVSKLENGISINFESMDRYLSVLNLDIEFQVNKK